MSHTGDVQNKRDITDGIYRIRAIELANYYLSPPNEAKDGDALELSKKQDQLWNIVSQENETYTITSLGSNMELVIPSPGNVLEVQGTIPYVRKRPYCTIDSQAPGFIIGMNNGPNVLAYTTGNSKRVHSEPRNNQSENQRWALQLVTGTSNPDGSIETNDDIDTDFKKLGRKFNGGKYVLVNKLTSSQIVVWGPSLDRPKTAAQVWTWPSAGTAVTDERKWTITYDDDTGGVAIKSPYNLPGYPDRWVGAGPNLRDSKQLCRMYRAKRDGDDIYYIVLDWARSPPLVIKTPQPSNVLWGTLIAEPLKVGDTTQQWQILSAP